MRILLALLSFAVCAACATPGYDYEARIAPNIPVAAEYRDVGVGKFRGPGGDVAEDEFVRMINDVTLDGAYWFGVGGIDTRRGVYEGDTQIDSWSAETRYERERRCTDYDGLFDCEHRSIVEKACTEETVNVTVTATLIDTDTNRRVFTQSQGGAATRDSCEDIAQYEDDGRDLGSWRDPLHSDYNPYNAPYGMIQDATVEAVNRFRTDIAPYMQTVRAEILTEGLIPEEQNDPRFKAAVDATKNGSFLGACAQWDQLGRDWPQAPAVQHNLGACAEARGDMATAQVRYARASELASSIPLLKDKKAQPIFDALERISNRRIDEKLLEDRVLPAPESDGAGS